LSFNRTDKLICGSWNGTAKIYDYNSTEVTLKLNRLLTGHSHAVATLHLPIEFKDVENAEFITGSQNGCIRIWNSDVTELRNIEKAHEDIIRSFCCNT